jgi:SulP family sulfate permease
MRLQALAKKFDPVEYFREFDFRDYLKFDFTNFKGDLSGGLTSAIVALPLALGFGILATNGDPRGAVAGLYGAVFTGIFASLFGGTPQQITGPTGGMTVILTQIFVQFHDINALLLACLIAGILQIVMGLFKLGKFVSFIPQPVISGFTNGIAILIFSQQLKTFFSAPLVALITIAFIIIVPLINRSLPKLFLGLLFGSLITFFLGDRIGAFLYSFDWKSLAFIRSQAVGIVGSIPNVLKLPAWPNASWASWHRAIPAGFAIAMLGYLETLLASVVVDSVTNTEHNSNRELVGQGIGNSAAALFGGIAGTGAIVRTMINIRSGGKTKLSGIICGLILVVVILSLAPVAGRIPLAALAGVLMMAAVGMFEWEPIKMLPKTPLADSLVFVTTMLVTVFADLISAVLIGMLMATFLFINRVSKLGIIPALERDISSISEETKKVMQRHKISVFGIEGPLFFGAVRSFSKAITNAMPDTLILDMKGVSIVDASGAQAVESIIQKMRGRKKRVLISGMRPEVRKILHELEIIQNVGADSFPDDLEKAIDYAVSLAENRQPNLSDYLKSDLIMLEAEVSDKKQLFEKAVDLAVEKGYVFDRKAFLESLWHREQDSPTTLGQGVAIPHSRSGAATDEVVVIYITLKKPIPGYVCDDGQPVKVILMISAGENIQGYLKVLKLIGQAMGRESVRLQLKQVLSPNQVMDVFHSSME